MKHEKKSDKTGWAKDLVGVTFVGVIMAVLLPPAIICLLRDSNLFTDLWDGLALTD